MDEDVARAAAPEQLPFGHRIKEGAVPPWRDAGTDLQASHSPVLKEPKLRSDQIVCPIGCPDDSHTQHEKEGYRQYSERHDRREALATARALVVGSKGTADDGGEQASNEESPSASA